MIDILIQLREKIMCTCCRKMLNIYVTLGSKNGSLIFHREICTCPEVQLRHAIHEFRLLSEVV